MLRNLYITALFFFVSIAGSAQVGKHRNVWSVGVNGGMTINKMSFMPDIPQVMHSGYTFGVVGRYTSEKYFSTICSLQLECNMTQSGWKEDIRTIEGDRVINPETGNAEEYQRNLTYLQIPFLAHLAWGKEKDGVNFFVNGGPQIGFMVNESVSRNYSTPFIPENFPDFTDGSPRSNVTVAQETLPLDYKFDYGIAVGAGLECDIKHLGRLSLEGRFYYGLGNIFADSKTDFFGKSAQSTIFVRMGWMYDL